MILKQEKIIKINDEKVNIFLIIGVKIIIVDSGYGESIDTIRKYFSDNDLSLSDVSLIILTHAPIDHFANVAELREITGASILIHQNDVEQLRLGKNPNLKYTRKLRPWFIETFVDPVYKISGIPVEPDIIIDDVFRLENYYIKGQIIPTPGHTKGSVSIILNQREAIFGDLIMESSFFGNVPCLPIFHDNLYEIKRVLQKY